MTCLSDERLAELRKLADEATPGPWGWRGHDDGLVELRGHGPFGRFDGRIVSAMRSEPCIVMLDEFHMALTVEACDPCKAAYGDAATDWSSHSCPKDDNLGTVWLSDKHGVEPANRWAKREQPYRADVAEVDHPDARFIAEARTALPDLLAEIDRLRERYAEALGTFHLMNRMAQAAYSAGLRDGPEACMEWLGNALSGPGNCPRPGSDPDWYVEDGWSRERLPMPAANATVNEPAAEDGGS